MRRSTLIVVLAFSIVLLVLVGRFYISEADFGLENPSWNGFSQISGTSLRPLYSMSELDGLSTGNTLLVVSPSNNYTPDEAATVAKFLQGGGNVVVMDDFGRANSLLEAINSPMTINPVPLAEYENYYTNHSLPVIKSFNPAAETTNVSQLVLNHPVPVNASGAAYVLASTSNRAWLDVNDNGVMDGGEVMGTYDVAAIAMYGNGRLIVVGDPDLSINSMLDMGDNRVFLSNILKGKVLVDVSHGRGPTPLGAVYYGIKYDIKFQILIVLLLFAGCYAYVGRRSLMGRIQRLIGREPGSR